MATIDEIIRTSTAYVRDYMSNYDSSHDFNHVRRVLSMARQIKAEEVASPNSQNLLLNDDIITLGALLHDIGDKKYIKPGQDPSRMVYDFLVSIGADGELASRVQTIATHVSYSSEIKDPAKVFAVIEKYPELAVVQDADRLDAIGATGIGRVFTYSATHSPSGGAMEDAIVHFEEKLERIEAIMKTQTGKRLARERTARLQLFKAWWAEENACLAS